MDQVITLLGKVREVLSASLQFIEAASSEDNVQKTAERLEKLGVSHDESIALSEKIGGLDSPAEIAETILSSLGGVEDLSLFKKAEDQTRAKATSQDTWDSYIESI